MSVLDVVLQEEYDRLIRMKRKMLEDYNTLPNGYISKKTINNHEYHYLQHREGKKIVCLYIKSVEVPFYEAQIEKRKRLKRSLKEIDDQMKKIERAIKSTTTHRKSTGRGEGSCPVRPCPQPICGAAAPDRAGGEA